MAHLWYRVSPSRLWLVCAQLPLLSVGWPEARACQSPILLCDLLPPLLADALTLAPWSPCFGKTWPDPCWRQASGQPCTFVLCQHLVPAGPGGCQLAKASPSDKAQISLPVLVGSRLPSCSPTGGRRRWQEPPGMEENRSRERKARAAPNESGLFSKRPQGSTRRGKWFFKLPPSVASDVLTYSVGFYLFLSTFIH